jgi:PAS domain S-box-containing protein
MRRRSTGPTKPRRSKAPAAKDRRKVEKIQGVTSSEGELRFAQLRRTRSEARQHHRRAEDALGESEHKLRKIIDTVPSFLWSADATGEPTYVNQRALDYSGMRFEEFKNGGWEAFIHPADFPGTKKAFGHAIETGTHFETVHRLRRWDGEYRWHQARGDPLRDQDGRIIQWYGLAVDIDDAKKAEERLRRSEHYLREAQRISHTGFFAFSRVTKKFLYWSEENYRIWGLDPDQGPPDPKIAAQRIHPDDRERVEKKAREARRKRRNFTLEFRALLPDGTIKYIEFDEYHLFSEGGELVESIGTIVDVTERKRAEEALRRGEAWLGQAQRLSHTGTWIMDGATRNFLYWSDESYRIWGFDPLGGVPSREDMWGRIHPDERERLWEATGLPRGTDIVGPPSHVRNVPNNGHQLSAPGCPVNSSPLERGLPGSRRVDHHAAPGRIAETSRGSSPESRRTRRGHLGPTRRVACEENTDICVQPYAA